MRRFCFIFVFILFLFVFTSTTIQYRFYHIKAEETYTEEEKAQAKAWLSAHGYPPTRAGAAQAYQDYLDGKFDDDSQVQAAAKANNVTTQDKQNNDATTTEDATTEEMTVADSTETYSNDRLPIAVEDTTTSMDLKREDGQEQKKHDRAIENNNIATKKTEPATREAVGSEKAIGWKDICFLGGELLVVIFMVIQVVRKK